jgi:indolepyruvate ferredoxin oxidoreductase alpha subunit
LNNPKFGWDECRMIGEEGSVSLLMGNEAVARGAIEAGVHIAIGYPGTPSSEVIPSLVPLAEAVGMRVEWAVNEKVAFDIATGASFAGSRCLVTMKSAGVNVASDSIMSVAYGDVNGGLVIYVADDPGAHAGMEETDSRLYSAISLLPMIDVTDPQDAKDAIVVAFGYSEEYRIPVFVRSTSSVAHMRGNVTLGPVEELEREPGMERDIRRFTRASPVWCQEQHALLNDRVERMRRVLEASAFNVMNVPGEAKVGVIASGNAVNYLKEVQANHGLTDLATLRVGTPNPLPEGLIRDLIERVEALLVLEELEPHVELRVRALAADHDRHVTIHGKHDGTLSKVGEFNYDIVEAAVGRLLGRSLGGRSPGMEEAMAKASELAPRRPLPFCPGCPHRGTYTAMKQALTELGYGKDEAIITGDIGCTILGMHPPFDMCWNEVSMGASIGLAIGIKYAGIDRPVIAAIGDSTFFHAGVPPMVNASMNEADIVIAVLDNRITAMTGHQPSPTSGYGATGDPRKEIQIEEILRASGIRSVQVVDPYDLEESKQAFIEAIKTKGPTAVVLSRTCSLVARRMRTTDPPSSVDPEKCTGCLLCVRTLSCPAMKIETDGKMSIDESACTGCKICLQVCPFDAIKAGGV